jgi:hypothetical protein
MFAGENSRLSSRHTKWLRSKGLQVNRSYFEGGYLSAALFCSKRRRRISLNCTVWPDFVVVRMPDSDDFVSLTLYPETDLERLQDAMRFGQQLLERGRPRLQDSSGAGPHFCLAGITVRPHVWTIATKPHMDCSIGDNGVSPIEAAIAC